MIDPADVLDIPRPIFPLGGDGTSDVDIVN